MSFRSRLRFRRLNSLLFVPLVAACGSNPAAPESDDTDPLACASEGAAGTPYVGGVNCRSITVDGYAREYIVYVPPGHAFTAESPAPLVFMFHGGGGFGERFLRISGWRQKADEVGLIAVFPTAVEYFILADNRWSTRWHEFGLPAEVDPNRRPTGYPDTSPWPADDVAFTRAMIDEIAARIPVDEDRVYASGFSNGATFTSRLAVEATDRFAAFAWVGGGFCTPVVPDWSGAPPRPTSMALGGVDHKLLQYMADGGPPPDSIPLDPVALLDIDPLADCLRNQVAAYDLAWTPRDTRELGDVTILSWSTPASVDYGNSFDFAVLSGLDHRYPNGLNNPLGFVAVDRFWDFFRQHRISP